MGASVSGEHSPAVSTLSGPVVGREYQLHDGRRVDMYMGIPYAEPPVGMLRFKVSHTRRATSEIGTYECN